MKRLADFFLVLNEVSSFLPIEDFNQISSLWGAVQEVTNYAHLLDADALRLRPLTSSFPDFP